MWLNLFSLKNTRLIFVFILFLQFQSVQSSETTSDSTKLSELWKSAIQNNRNRNHYAALADYSKALIIAPNNHLLFYNRGLTYANLQLLTQAINDFDNSIKIKPDFAPGYGDRGMAYYDLDQKYKACADFKKAADLKYKRAVTWIKDSERNSWCIK